MEKEFDETMNKQAKAVALLAVRNTLLEDLHAGIVPVSKAGDYSDVKVVTPEGEIPWNEVSRLNDAEMKKLMKQVVNRLYTCLHAMHSASRDEEAFEHLIQTGLRQTGDWDDAEVDKVLTTIMENRS